jgi:hypothetical protein
MLLKDTSGLAGGIASLGSSLGKVLEKVIEDNKYKEILNAGTRPEDSLLYKIMASAQAQQAQKQQVQEQAPIDQTQLDQQDQTQSQAEQIPVNQEQFSPQPLQQVTQGQMPAEALSGVVGSSTPQLSFEDIMRIEKQRQIDNKRRQATALINVGHKDEAMMMAQEANQMQQQLHQDIRDDKKLSQKISMEKEKRAFETNKPYLEEINKSADQIPIKQRAINTMRDSIGQMTRGTKVQDLLTAILPDSVQEFVRSTPGANLLGASKEFYVNVFKELPQGTRLNQYIEKIVFQALETVGKSKESNAVLIESQQYDIDLQKKRNEIAQNLRKKYLQEGKELPVDFQDKVREMVQPYAIKRADELQNTFQNIKRKKYNFEKMRPIERKTTLPKVREGYTLMKAPNGNYAEVPNNMVDKALKSGGKRVNDN